MLSLMDPVELEGLVVFRDDELTNKFYLLPDQPVIPVDDQGEPEFLFIKYLKDIDATAEGESVGGGLLQFRTVLTIDPDRRQRVVAALTARLTAEKAAGKRPFGLAIESTEPLLAAPLWTDGKVSLATFQASDTGLVRHATETVPVDLAGDLGASLSLELDETGAEIFWGAFEDWRAGQIPILISYQLTYKARVSAKMTIHAERKVLHRRIRQQARPYRLLRMPFLRYAAMPFSGELTTARLVALRAATRESVAAMVTPQAVQEAVQGTITDNEITVHIETDSAGTAAEGVQDALFKIATEVLSDRVIPALFGTAGTQPGASSESADRPDQELLQVPDDDGGSATFDLALDHLSTIERTVNPNGPVQLLLPDPAALERSFRALRLSDGFFSLMQVTATTVGVNFERDGIDSIHVFFHYEERDEADPARPWIRRAQDGLLRSETDVLHWRFDTARAADGSHKRAYDYRMEVFYREGPPSRTEFTPRSDRMLSITPRAMGALRVELVLTAPRERVESARVALSYRTPAGDRFQTALELTAENDKRTWFQYTGELAAVGADPRPPTYSYQVTYRCGDGEIVMPWVESSAQTLEIPSPFRKVLTWNVRPQGSFDGVGSIAGDITYDDPEHHYRVHRAFQLTSLTDGFLFQVPALDGGPEMASWTARVNRADGSALALDPGQGPPGTVWVGAATNFLSVQVIPDLLDFQADVQLAVVQLNYQDAANGISERATFTFSKSASAPQTWTVGRRDPQLGTYDADIRYIAYDRSKSSEVHLHQIEDQVLVLDRAAG